MTLSHVKSTYISGVDIISDIFQSRNCSCSRFVIWYYGQWWLIWYFTKECSHWQCASKHPTYRVGRVILQLYYVRKLVSCCLVFFPDILNSPLHFVLGLSRLINLVCDLGNIVSYLFCLAGVSASHYIEYGIFVFKSWVCMICLRISLLTQYHLIMKYSCSFHS